MTEAEQTPPTGGHESPDTSTVVVVGPDGRPIGTVEMDPAAMSDGEEDVSRLVEQPAKVMRIGSMIKQLLEEVKAAPLDEKARVRLTEIHRRSITELEDGLAPELVEELERLSLPFEEGHLPSVDELRMAQAQLVGWLEGLFHGIQAALVAQQMAATAAARADAHRSPGPADGPGRTTGPGWRARSPWRPVQPVRAPRPVPLTLSTP
jgi:hypothetical protein